MELVHSRSGPTVASFDARTGRANNHGFGAIFFYFWRGSFFHVARVSESGAFGRSTDRVDDNKIRFNKKIYDSIINHFYHFLRTFGVGGILVSPSRDACVRRCCFGAMVTQPQRKAR